MEKKLKEIKIPEIWETEEDKIFSTGQLKHSYLKIAKQKFQGKVFINKNIEKPI